MTGAKRVKFIRRTLGLKQKDFAMQISVSTSYLASVETEVRNLNDRTIRLISDAFNVNGHWIKTGDGEMFNDGVDASVAKITGLFKSLSSQFQESAIEQLRALVELER